VRKEKTCVQFGLTMVALPCCVTSASPSSPSLAIHFLSLSFAASAWAGVLKVAISTLGSIGLHSVMAQVLFLVCGGRLFWIVICPGPSRCTNAPVSVSIHILNLLCHRLQVVYVYHIVSNIHFQRHANPEGPNDYHELYAGRPRGCLGKLAD